MMSKTSINGHFKENFNQNHDQMEKAGLKFSRSEKAETRLWWVSRLKETSLKFKAAWLQRTVSNELYSTENSVALDQWSRQSKSPRQPKTRWTLFNVHVLLSKCNSVHRSNAISICTRDEHGTYMDQPVNIWYFVHCEGVRQILNGFCGQWAASEKNVIQVS